VMYLLNGCEKGEGGEKKGENTGAIARRRTDRALRRDDEGRGGKQGLSAHERKKGRYRCAAPGGEKTANVGKKKGGRKEKVAHVFRPEKGRELSQTCSGQYKTSIKKRGGDAIVCVVSTRERKKWFRSLSRSRCTTKN